MERVIGTLAFLLVIIHAGQAIKCYVCTHQEVTDYGSHTKEEIDPYIVKDAKCKDNSNTYSDAASSQIVTCPSSVKYCSKSVVDVETAGSKGKMNMKVYTRECDRHNANSEGCTKDKSEMQGYMPSGVTFKKGVGCTCKTDSCNSATMSKMSPIILIASFLLLIAKLF